MKNVLVWNRILISALVAVFLAVAVSAQRDDDEVIRIDSDLQTFDVTVTDETGKFVRGLEAGNFKIYEDGVERKIDFFEQTNKINGTRPIAIVFALDVSGSVTTVELERLRVAMRAFLAKLTDKNASFAIMAFGMRVKTLQGFTSDASKLEKVFDKLLRDESGSSSHVYDAVDDAIRLLDRKAPHARGQIPLKKNVIVVTDGFPVGDTVAPRTVIERANDSQTSIFTVTLPSFSKISLQPQKKPLLTPLDVSGLADKTGGKNVYATDRDFEPLFRSLAEDVTASYLIAFQPTEENRRDKRFHSVKITATRKNLQVRQNRNGYHNPPENEKR